MKNDEWMNIIIIGGWMLQTWHMMHYLGNCWLMDSLLNPIPWGQDVLYGPIVQNCLSIIIKKKSNQTC